MRKHIFILTLALAIMTLMNSCGTTTRTQLYSWGGYNDGVSRYEENVYKRYKTQTSESLCSLMVTYESMINTPGGERLVPPPGICADYGFILLDPETATVFAETATDSQKAKIIRTDYLEYGIELLEKEIQYYPEAKKFIEPIIKRVKRQGK